MSSSPASETRHKTPFVTPVIGLICNEDVPAMMASKSNITKSRLARSLDAINTDGKQKESSRFTVVRQKDKTGDGRVGGGGGDDDDDDDDEAEWRPPNNPT